MDPARIAELLQPFVGSANDQPLTTDDLASISTYIDVLLRWNARINLTALRDPEQIVTRHFGESLFAARHLFPDRSWTAVRVADVGSGAGFPGLPIRLWAPNLVLTLIESNHKKATFLREVVRLLTLTNVNVQSERAEAIASAEFDIVTLRAVERFESVLPTAASLVSRGGRLALLIGSGQLTQAQDLLSKPTHAGRQPFAAGWFEPIPIPLSTSRILAIASREPGIQESRSLIH